MDSFVGRYLKEHATLPVQRFSQCNYLAHRLEEPGLRVFIPLESIHNTALADMANADWIGMLTSTLVKCKQPNREAMQNASIGYLAVSLGYYRTLFSVSGASNIL